MKSVFFKCNAAAILIISLSFTFLPGPVGAEKPSGTGHGKSHKNEAKSMENKNTGQGKAEQGKAGESGGVERGGHGYFTEQQRSFIHDYYADEYRKGDCPPGLAKKHNGCMPPGQAKKWGIGKRLPSDVIFYDLPPSILVQLGPAPSQHKFVRVAQDILLIAVGTGMVVDAIEDLNWEFGH